jgi:hypothetical protein
MAFKLTHLRVRDAVYVDDVLFGETQTGLGCRIEARVRWPLSQFRDQRLIKTGRYRRRRSGLIPSILVAQDGGGPQPAVLKDAGVNGATPDLVEQTPMVGGQRCV